jgi:hypothetical protein
MHSEHNKPYFESLKRTRLEWVSADWDAAAGQINIMGAEVTASLRLQALTA